MGGSPSRKQKLIKAELPGADPANRDDWPRQHAWIHEKLNALQATFSSAAKSLDPADYDPDDEEEPSISPE